MTGKLDDGTAGLQAIKASGGIAVVQDPAEAEAPDMPARALRHVAVDHCVGFAALPQLLVELTQQAPAATPALRSHGAAHEKRSARRVTASP